VMLFMEEEGYICWEAAWCQFGASSAGRQHCYPGPEPQGPNLQIDSHIDITSLLLTSLHSYSSHVFVLE